MRQRFKLKYYVFLFAITIVSCAQFDTPKGGQKDIYPPILDESQSDKNLQTNFKQRRITLTFNEWIKVNNPVKEIVVSPPTNYPPKVIEKGKSVVFEFSEKEVLQENTTYQINYGDAVRDLTEGNVYKNLIFIFSTGDVIDSLSIKGKVLDALTQKPLSDIIVSIYENLSDTAILTSKPSYFTKTSKNGDYELNNLRVGEYQIYALKDDNVNYYYDLPSEKIAFFDSTILLTPQDSFLITLELFDEENKPRLLEKKQKQNGLIKLVYNEVPKSVSIRSLDTLHQYVYHEIIKDTIYLWHDGQNKDSLSFEITTNIFNIDTTKVIFGPSVPFNPNIKLEENANKKISFHSSDSIAIKLNRPLSDININNFIVYDTVRSYPIKNIATSNRSLFLFPDSLSHSHSYQLRILPNGIQDIYDNYNQDTINLELTAYDPKNFGSIELHISAPIDTQYIVEFMNKTVVVDKFIIKGSDILTIAPIAKGKYNLRITEDLNENEFWSSGNLQEKKRPERIKEISLDELKSGWDLKLDVDIKHIFDGTKVE